MKSWVKQTIDKNIQTERMQTSAIEAAVLNFIERRISCQHYFCRIVKFGEDISNYSRYMNKFIIIIIIIIIINWQVIDFQHGAGFDREL